MRIYVYICINWKKTGLLGSDVFNLSLLFNLILDGCVVAFTCQNLQRPSIYIKTILDTFKQKISENCKKVMDSIPRVTYVT